MTLIKLSMAELNDLIDCLDEKVRGYPESECPLFLLDLHEKLINFYYEMMTKNDSNS